jgi:hypothetical protein
MSADEANDSDRVFNLIVEGITHLVETVLADIPDASETDTRNTIMEKYPAMRYDRIFISCLPCIYNRVVLQRKMRLVQCLTDIQQENEQ